MGNTVPCQSVLACATLDRVRQFCWSRQWQLSRNYCPSRPLAPIEWKQHLRERNPDVGLTWKGPNRPPHRRILCKACSAEPKISIHNLFYNIDFSYFRNNDSLTKWKIFCKRFSLSPTHMERQSAPFLDIKDTFRFELPHSAANALARRVFPVPGFFFIVIL